jgi:hypothetical protein
MAVNAFQMPQENPVQFLSPDTAAQKSKKCLK